uniref:Uncharacterized protein MANES_16G042700 n=1 Tax=Rhizophora mucronata TaxID=61149 RepID=A0A2P2QU71_RHIMU
MLYRLDKQQKSLKERESQKISKENNIKGRNRSTCVTFAQQGDFGPADTSLCSYQNSHFPPSNKFRSRM